MGLYDTFGTDANLEAGAGLVLDYGDAKITIHRAGGANKKFSMVAGAKLRPHKALLDKGAVPDDVAMKILAETYAEAVIIGWEGVTGKDGKPMPFTKENCVKLLTDLPDLFADIRAQAESMAAFKHAQEEEDQKN